MTQKPLLFYETPLLENPKISRRLEKRIFLKMECYQPVGSFKARGIGNLCAKEVEAGKKHLVSSSGGNAGYAAAYAGGQLGVKVTVVMPENATEQAKQRIIDEGAELIIHGAHWVEADQLAREIVQKNDAAYIHPFENPHVWAGHATMIDEAVLQCPKPDAVALCVGGGGLLCGVVEGMHRNGWDDVPVLPVETQGADSFAATAQAGKLVQLDRIQSIATTLGATQVTGAAFSWYQKHPIQSVVVSDKDAVDACLNFADDMRVIVEPSCGASLSLLYNHSHYLESYDSVLMIVCGGAGVTLQQLQQWSRDLL